MESGVTSSAHAVETPASANKETWMFGNQDTFGPSFSEMVKSTKKPPLQYDASESADGGPGGKGTKKKAKKGNQIDPSLLGFKVHSNRIFDCGATRLMAANNDFAVKKFDVERCSLLIALLSHGQAM